MRTTLPTRSCLWLVYRGTRALWICWISLLFVFTWKQISAWLRTDSRDGGKITIGDAKGNAEEHRHEWTTDVHPEGKQE